MLVIVFILKQEKIMAISGPMQWPCMTLSTVSDRREKLNRLWRSDTLTRHLAWCVVKLFYGIYGTLRFVVCDVFHCGVHYNSLREMTPSQVTSLAHSDESWEMNQKWVDFVTNSLKRFCTTKILQIYASPLDIQRFPVVTVVLIYQWVLLATYPPLTQHQANQTRKTSESMIY